MKPTLLLLTILISLSSYGQVGIGTTNPDPSAALEVQSTSQGFLPPRLSLFQRDNISNPVAGLVIWCTNCGTNGQLQVFNGNEWTNLIGGAVEDFTDLGSAIGEGFGNAEGEYLGEYISLSENGETIVTGGNTFSGNSPYLRTFDWNGNIYSATLGNDIILPSPIRDIALSEDGNRLIVGMPLNNSLSGMVQVYERDNATWVQLGTDFNGLATNDNLGQSVSISEDGNIIAFGVPGSNSSQGETQIFEWNGSSWIQIGSSVQGISNGERCGSSVSISKDGLFIAVGSPFGSNPNLSNDLTGLLRVFQFSGSDWAQLGSTLYGEAADDEFGSECDLSGNGNFLAIGAPKHDGNSGNNSSNFGQVSVFQFDTDWILIGNRIDGFTQANLNFGDNIKINNGTRLAVGLPNAIVGTAVDAGTVQIYNLENLNWTLDLNSSVQGSIANERLGNGIDINSNGSILAVGLPGVSVFVDNIGFFLVNGSF